MASETGEYYRGFLTNGLSPCLTDYIRQKEKQDKKLNIIMISFVAALLIMLIGISKPIFAKNDNIEVKIAQDNSIIWQQKNFEENIKNKYAGSYIQFPTRGLAHIKKTKYINSRPVRLNIIEINTKVNPNLKIKPQIAGEKLNSKSSVRRIAQKEDAIVAINGGFFKPRTGVPLGALMIDKNFLAGPIFNRVGMAIFEDDNGVSFKLENIKLDISLKTNEGIVKIDNFNQPRMLSVHSILYDSNWNYKSPTAPNGGYNALIQNKEIVKISANPIEIKENEYVLSAPKKIIRKLINKKIDIEIKSNENLKTANHIIGAGPYLVKDSEIYVDYKEQKLQAISGKNPRSAVGFKNNGTFIIVTVDGREKDSVGMTLFELAKLMKNLGCNYAMNFDGGSSSALYVKGKIVNSAINKEGIAVSNALTISEFNPYQMQLTSIKNSEEVL